MPRRCLMVTAIVGTRPDYCAACVASIRQAIDGAKTARRLLKLEEAQ